MSGLYRLDPLETAGGFVVGTAHLYAAPRPPSTGARAALESVLLERLQRPPLVVAFSGGRDSSALLALAVHVARREGLPLPEPVIHTYPGHPDADEREHQDAVLRHLAVTATRVDHTAAKDALGPDARAHLDRHGPTWPCLAHDKSALFRLARGGGVVTGDGGDEVLGGQRVTPLVGCWQTRRRPDAEVRRAVGYAVAPRVVRRAVLRREGWGEQSWLRPHARWAFAERLRAQEAAKRLRWSDGVRAVPLARSAVHGLATLRRLGQLQDVSYDWPLLDPRFTEAFAAAGGRFGHRGRTAALRHLVGDLLPDVALTRTGKARFNTVVFGPGARDFVATWDGAGVDPQLVDPSELHRLWRLPAPPAGTLALLQHAWWSTRGVR